MMKQKEEEAKKPPQKPKRGNTLRHSAANSQPTKVIRKTLKESLKEESDPERDDSWPEHIIRLCYQVNRFEEESSPMCVYIPNKKVLFKMMKACIGVEDVEDLWIYNEKLHSHDMQQYTDNASNSQSQSSRDH